MTISVYCSHDKIITILICSHIRVSNMDFSAAGLPSVYILKNYFFN